MVFIDKNGQRCEVQYCVVVWAGRDEGIRQYRWASEEQIQKAIKIFEKCPLAYNMHAIYVRTRNFKEDLIWKERMHAGGWNRLIKDKTMSDIEINVMDERWADLCAEKLGLPLPLPDIEYDPLSKKS